jgi:LPXTG-motif cell wall-anchored protein
MRDQLHILKRTAGVAVAMALLVLGAMAFSASPASADARCRLSDFRNADGTLDTTSYLACVAAANGTNTAGTTTATGTLPTTGSDSGQMLGLATVLIVLGVGATVGAKKFRTATDTIE